MRIAIPTNDRESIFTRTGQAKLFAIYNIDGMNALFLEFRENPHKHEETEEHAHEHNHLDMVEALKDCQALLVKIAGKHLRSDFEIANIKLLKTKENQLQCVANSFAKSPQEHSQI